MAVLETSWQMILAVLISVICGYGLVGFLWPREQDECRHLITACVGYPGLILLTHFVSGTFLLGVQLTTIIVFILLATLSVYAWWIKDRSAGISLVLRQLGFSCLLALPMLVVVLWPLFAVGADTYQATVNPDFFMGLLDNEWLRNHPTNVIRSDRDTSAYAIFDSITGSIAESARYRGAYFAILLEGLFNMPQRTGLALTIGLFHFCMPISLYAMVRVALGQSKRVAILSAVLLGISSSISLGYLSYYIGQASGLGFLPLLITTWFLCLTKPGARIFLLALILTSALWVMYLGLVPYAGAPVLGLFLYLLLTRNLSLRAGIVLALGSAGFILLIHIRMLGMLTGALRAWTSLVGNTTLLGQYYIDFVSERFFPMFFGLTIYSPDTSRLRQSLGISFYLLILYALSLCVSVALLLSFLRWVWTTKDRRHLAIGLSCAAAYAAVVLNFIFVHPFGYGSFKNATWLQFILMFFASIGIWSLWDVLSRRTARWQKAVAWSLLIFAAVPFVGGNLFSSWEYGMIGLGHDTENGNIVVVHNLSGNRDYFELSSVSGEHVKPHESIGISLVNTAQQCWAMYYLRQSRLSYLGQWQLPGEDEKPPDVHTGRVIDAYGNVTIDSPTFFHGATDDYYLVNQPSTVNGSIVKNRYPKPVWENSTFKLVRASETPDFMFVGRGFYRTEYRTADTYYMPQAMKWTAEGGELYLLRAGQPGRPYRLAFTAHTGPGLSSPLRTIEFFHNRQKFGRDKVINGFGRIVSDPFYPKGGVDRLAIRIKEKVEAPTRPFALWNTDLPIYRKVNLSFSDIELLPPGEPPCQLGLGQPISGADLFTKSYSFNGIEANQWAREAMNLSFVRPSEASSLTLSVTAPGVAQLRFPMQLKLTVDGVQAVHLLKQPGTVVLRTRLGDFDGCGSVTEVSLEVNQTFTPRDPNTRDRVAEVISRLGWSRLNRVMDDAIRTRSRHMLYSVRLESLQFD